MESSKLKPLPGYRLRELRLERLELRNARGERVTVSGCRATKEFVADYAGISTRSLTRIEDGVTGQPGRPIIEAILTVLDQCKEVPLVESYAILTGYGYKAMVAPPSLTDVARARQSWQRMSAGLWQPAYLVDITHRLWDWNRCALRLHGFAPADLQAIKCGSLDRLEMLFKPGPRYVEILNRDEYVLGFVYTIKCQYQLYGNEPWCSTWVEAAQERYPEFARLWHAIPDTLLFATSLGNPIPIIIRTRPGKETLGFRLNSIAFVNDPRFFVTQWEPLDRATLYYCLFGEEQKA